MAALLLAPSVASLAAPCRVAVRASASSGTRATPTSLSGSQLLSRLDDLRLKARSGGLAAVERNPAVETVEGFTSTFSEHRARLQYWWKDHLESKAAMVEAACPGVPVEEEIEELLVFKRPVEVESYFPVRKTT